MVHPRLFTKQRAVSKLASSWTGSGGTMAGIGGEIKRRREELNMSQPQVAVRAGVAVSAVSQIENGRRSPNVSTLEKIAEALNTEVVDLFPKAQAPLPFEDEQRRLLPYVRPWLSLIDSISENLERIAAPGEFDAGMFLASGDFYAAAMSSMNMVLRELKAQGIDPMTGTIGDELRSSMLRYAAAARASSDAALQALSESDLAKVRKRRAERQAELGNLPTFDQEAAT